MDNCLAYPTLIATAVSIIGLTYLAVREHRSDIPRTISLIAASKPGSLRYFRLVLWFCGILFAVSMYGYVIPRITLSSWHALAWTVTIFAELSLALVPASGRTLRTHNILALAMGVGMLGSAWLFVLSFESGFRTAAIVASVAMSMLALSTVLDKKRFIFYELPFIFLAHVSIVIAVVAVSE